MQDRISRLKPWQQGLLCFILGFLILLPLIWLIKVRQALISALAPFLAALIVAYLLAPLVSYMAVSYTHLDVYKRQVEEGGSRPVPPHLRGTGYRGAARLGHSKGYLYPHDFPGHHVEQRYLPPELAGRRFYRPGEEGFEKQIRERLDRLRPPRAGDAAQGKGKQKTGDLPGSGGSGADKGIEGEKREK